jgi:hypothetical protein
MALLFLYVDDVRTSQETWASMVCYGESFTFLYVDDVRTSQEAHASTAYYRDSFTLQRRRQGWPTTICFSYLHNMNAHS